MTQREPAEFPRVRDFVLNVRDAELGDLRARLERIRWPDQETVADWSQGVPLAYMKELCHSWLHEYDWRTFEAEFNSFPNFKVEFGGVDIHFMHVRSPEPDAPALLLTHGWPGSVSEFMKVIRPLTDPRAHGGDPADAFNVVCPSLPGYGFSGHPKEPGWGVERIAGVWAGLMKLLGYRRWIAHGGDWGAAVSTRIGMLRPEGCVALHLTRPVVGADPATMNELTSEETETLEQRARFQQDSMGYSTQQATRPQTVGYALDDSPVGQAAWIVEKFCEWTDCEGHPENVLTRTELLNNITVYWLNRTATSSARLYWESWRRSEAETAPVLLPTGCSIFPKELFRPSRRWAARRYKDIVYWGTPDKGGHFPAAEQPAVFVEELRSFRRHLRN